jgi:hypothetical protein
VDTTVTNPLLDIIDSAGDGAAIEAIARQHGVAPREARQVIAALLPQFSLALERNTLSRGGLADLVGALGQGHHAYVLDHPEVLTDPRVQSDGLRILDHLVVNKDGSRAVAARAAAASGLSESVIKAMLPTIASVLMGALSKFLQGGLGDILQRVPTRQYEPNRGDGGMPQLPPVGLPQQPAPSAPWPSPSSSQGRATPTWSDDAPTIPRPGGAAVQRAPQSDSAWPPAAEGPAPRPLPRTQQPLPLPGERVPGMQGEGDNPFGDLSDIIRRGGGLPGDAGMGSAPVGGGMLWTIVRNILGGALGFQGRGIMGWIVRMIMMRFGYGLLRTILGRLILRR